MNRKIPLRALELQLLSSGSKIGVQLMWFVVIVILPLINPNIIQFHNPISIKINVLLALATSILYEILKVVYRKKGKDFRWVVTAQLLTSIILLTWFLHVFGRINGPFFVLYLLTIMESALNLSIFFPNVVVTIAAIATVSEFIWLLYGGEISLNLYSLLQVFIRIMSLFLMRSYGISLAQKLIEVEKTRELTQEYAKNLESVKKELESANIKLKELDSQKDTFISMAAHELRAPMTAIKGYVSMILEGDAGDIPEKARGFLADVDSINDRLIRLVNNMLNVSRIEEGRMVFQNEYEQLTNIVRIVYSEFIPEATRKGLEYKLDVPKKIRDKIFVDVDKINEVIGNLVSNAVKYTDKGSVVVSLSQPQEGIVRLEVRDTGSGISKDEQSKLFHKFYRVESNVGKTTGTGLGLYISKLLIEKFNGKIGLESEADKGSVFWFELPVAS